jgi:hypothetical protein
MNFVLIAPGQPAVPVKVVDGCSGQSDSNSTGCESLRSGATQEQCNIKRRGVMTVPLA